MYRICLIIGLWCRNVLHMYKDRFIMYEATAKCLCMRSGLECRSGLHNAYCICIMYEDIECRSGLYIYV